MGAGMIANKPAWAAATGVAGLAMLMLAGPAMADVKAGVDAWSAGNYAAAVAEWRAPAAKGDPDAMFNLAQAYRLGRGVGEDIKQAETLYARAAAKGHLKAADNYGLLLFQDGRRELAMPYITAAAERGDPRAQYLLGVAHFNGDLVVKDWVRAYALLTLANGAGLPQASPAIREMDEHVPLAQRQQAQTLAAAMRANADARRSSDMAAVDLQGMPPAAVFSAPRDIAAMVTPPAARVPQPVVAVPITPSIAAAEAAVLEAMRATGTESPAAAGADFARPAAAARPARDVAQAVTQPVRAAAPPQSRPAATPGGVWKVQLGAFSVPANADKAWAQAVGRGALAGKDKVLQRSGNITRLLASGWSTQAAAQSACASLKASGQACLVTR